MMLQTMLETNTRFTIGYAHDSYMSQCKTRAEKTYAEIATAVHHAKYAEERACGVFGAYFGALGRFASLDGVRGPMSERQAAATEAMMGIPEVASSDVMVVDKEVQVRAEELLMERMEQIVTDLRESVLTVVRKYEDAYLDKQSAVAAQLRAECEVEELTEMVTTLRLRLHKTQSNANANAKRDVNVAVAVEDEEEKRDEKEEEEEHNSRDGSHVHVALLGAGSDVQCASTQKDAEASSWTTMTTDEEASEEDSSVEREDADESATEGCEDVLAMRSVVDDDVVGVHDDPCLDDAHGHVAADRSPSTAAVPAPGQLPSPVCDVVSIAAPECDSDVVEVPMDGNNVADSVVATGQVVGHGDGGMPDIWEHRCEVCRRLSSWCGPCFRVYWAHFQAWEQRCREEDRWLREQALAIRVANMKKREMEKKKKREEEEEEEAARAEPEEEDEDEEEKEDEQVEIPMEMVATTIDRVQAQEEKPAKVWAHQEAQEAVRQRSRPGFRSPDADTVAVLAPSPSAYSPPSHVQPHPQPVLSPSPVTRLTGKSTSTVKSSETTVKTRASVRGKTKSTSTITPKSDAPSSPRYAQSALKTTTKGRTGTTRTNVATPTVEAKASSTTTMTRTTLMTTRKVKQQAAPTRRWR